MIPGYQQGNSLSGTIALLSQLILWIYYLLVTEPVRFSLDQKHSLPVRIKPLRRFRDRGVTLLGGFGNRVNIDFVFPLYKRIYNIDASWNVYDTSFAFYCGKKISKTFAAYNLVDLLGLLRKICSKNVLKVGVSRPSASLWICGVRLTRESNTTACAAASAASFYKYSEGRALSQ